MSPSLKADKARQLSIVRALRVEKERRIEVEAFESGRQDMESSLAAFTHAAWEIIEPGTKLVWNWHLDTMCGYLEAVADGRVKRLIINVPPGSMKSLLASVMFPAWVWTRYPEKRFLGVTNESGLATLHAGLMRIVVGSEWYQDRWDVRFQKKQDEKTLFRNEDLGHRQSVGLNGNVTGKRANYLVLDDPHDARRAFSDVDIANAIRAYDQGLSNRLNDMEEDSVILIMQRLRTNDLTGHLLSKKQEKWVHLCIPMEYEGQSFDAGRDIGRPDLNDPRKKAGELMFPQRFGPDVVAREKEDKGEYGYAGQHQQRPVPLSGGILKAKWWKKWPKDKPLPDIQHVFLSWDTAYTKADLAGNAYSAMTKWGVFESKEKKRPALLLLDAWWGQVDYPELEAKAKAEWKKTLAALPKGATAKQLIEKKASGISLIQSLRAANIGVRTYTPDRDKVSRAFAAQKYFSDGLIWIPDRQWADAVVGHVASFPKGMPPSADLTDTCTQAVLYVRDGRWIDSPEDDGKENRKPIKADQTMGMYG